MGLWLIASLGFIFILDCLGVTGLNSFNLTSLSSVGSTFARYGNTLIRVELMRTTLIYGFNLKSWLTRRLDLLNRSKTFATEILFA